MKTFFSNNISFLEEKFSKNLPVEIFQSLKSKNLTNGKTQQFLIDNGQSEKVSVTVSALYTPAKEGNPELIELKFAFKDENSSLHQFFTDKTWYLTNIRDASRRDYPNGNKQACPIAGLSDEQCKQRTPQVTATVVNIINQLENEPTYIHTP